MRAVSVEGINRFRIVEVPLPEIGEDEVLVKVDTCGLCGTDIDIYEGVIPVKFPVIIGHEFTGLVERVGKKVKKFQKGDPVTANLATGCGECEYCQNGRENLCTHFPRYPGFRPEDSGAFAEYIKVKENSLYHLPSSIDLETASLVEPLSCCIHGVDIAEIKIGDRVIIFGAGTIGLLMVQLVRLSGANKIIVVEKKEEKRKIAHLLGADITLRELPENDDKSGRDNELLPRANIVLECTGISQVQEQAFSFLKPAGTIVLFGVAHPQDKVNINPFSIYRDEIMIKGSYANPYTTFRAIQILAEKRIKTEGLITHRFPLSNFGDAIETYKKENKRIKIVIKPTTQEET